jgi:hypothetical protein
MIMKNETHPIEVLSFRNGDNLATITTDGTRNVSQEFELCKEYTTLSKAISYLEAKGDGILMDGFESL